LKDITLVLLIAVCFLAAIAGLVLMLQECNHDLKVVTIKLERCRQVSVYYHEQLQERNEALRELLSASKRLREEEDLAFVEWGVKGKK